MLPATTEARESGNQAKPRNGSKWLRESLVEAPWGAARSKGTYLSALYHRLAARRGKKRALIAVGHAILVVAYYLISCQQN